MSKHQQAGKYIIGGLLLIAVIVVIIILTRKSKKCCCSVFKDTGACGVFAGSNYKLCDKGNMTISDGTTSLSVDCEELKKYSECVIPDNCSKDECKDFPTCKFPV